MSFDTEKNMSDSYKITLVEIDIPVTDVFIINYEAGVWYSKLSWEGITVTDDYGITGYYSKEKTFINRVGSLSVDGENYTKVSSLANLRTQNKSFYFVTGSQLLYIHFDLWGHPLSQILSIGATTGYSDKPKLDVNGTPTDPYYDDIYYDPRIMAVPAIATKKDRLFFGIIQFRGGTIKFNNEDGNFDDFSKQDIYGQSVRVYYGFNDLLFSEYRQVFSGFVDDFNYNFDTFSLAILDKRQFLKRKLPIRTFNQDDYTDLNEDNVDIPKPLAWGQVINVPCICINEDEVAPANYQFMFLDTTDNDANAFQNAYVEGVEKSPVSSSLSTGLFVLDTGDYNPGDEVTAKFIGFDESGSAIENGLDVIKDIFAKYANISYISDNYDQSEYGYETQIAPDVGIWVGDGKERAIEDIVSEISVSIDAIILFKDNGLITARSYRSNRVITRVIATDEWLDQPRISYPAEEYLSSTVCLYSQDITEDKYKRYRNTASETDVFEQYGQYKEKDYETLLTNATDAQAKTENVMDISKQILQNVTRKTKTQNIDLEIMQFVACEHSRPSSEEKDWAVYEILGITKNLTKAEIQLQSRRVRDYEVPEFDYSQGIIWYHKIFNHKIYAVTQY